MRQRYAAASGFDQFLATAVKNADLWRAVYKRATVPRSYVERLEAVGRPVHLLVLSEDWCGDAVNTVPIVARLAEAASNADLKILARDENLDLMDTHLTGPSRSIPVVMALDADYGECGWWGPRPAALQHWVLGPGQLLEKTERYREMRRWYATDQGLTVLDELLPIIERCGREKLDSRTDAA